MARMRYVKPEYWTDGVIVNLSPLARLFYIGTWNFAICDSGHLADDALGLKLKILPADPVNATELLDELINAGRIVRRTTPDGRTYLHIPRLADHQKVESRWSTRCPFCAHEANGQPAPATEPAEAEPEEWPAETTEPLPTSPDLAGVSEDSPKLGLGGDRRGGEGIGEEVRPSDVQAAPKARAAPGRGTRIPDDFAPTLEMIAWARRETPLVGARETASFVDYWAGLAGAKARKADWPATWRNWMRRAQSDAERGRASPGNALAVRASPPPSTTDSRVQAALDLGAQLAREATA